MAEQDWKPEWFFFYGTLQIPELLQRIIGSETAPSLYRASNNTHKIMMWGPYPAAVKKTEEERRNSEEIWGMTCLIEKKVHLQRLIAYEGENYGICDDFPIRREDSTESERGSCFVWQGYPEELEDGSFDPALFPIPSADAKDSDPSGEYDGMGDLEAAELIKEERADDVSAD